jgi:hypothetical protein
MLTFEESKFVDEYDAMLSESVNQQAGLEDDIVWKRMDLEDDLIQAQRKVAALEERLTNMRDGIIRESGKRTDQAKKFLKALTFVVLLSLVGGTVYTRFTASSTQEPIMIAGCIIGEILCVVGILDAIVLKTHGFTNRWTSRLAQRWGDSYRESEFKNIDRFQENT